MLNDTILKSLEGREVEYISFDRAQSHDDENVKFPQEFLNSIEDPGLPPHRLILKQNCVVMLLRNLSLQQGLCNGTRLQVITMSKNVSICKILTGDKEGSEVALPRIPVMSNSTDLSLQIVRHQFPIKLAYAMTINKSQGQTLESVGIYLEKEAVVNFFSDEGDGVPDVRSRDVVLDGGPGGQSRDGVLDGEDRGGAENDENLVNDPISAEGEWAMGALSAYPADVGCEKLWPESGRPSWSMNRWSVGFLGVFSGAGLLGFLCCWGSSSSVFFSAVAEKAKSSSSTGLLSLVTSAAPPLG
ncbi:hypothetical protein QR680_006519 [Steinernema hermaphroditum]|uniref:DNA helicase Pif1-like 2B domain-containing protein n=1 Tax=Steinernema hermaphroditum TaxID=289476 RepID=A0AA39HY41_9BILA|nr:hypothetical protein QR680_006519 [Steinernema hermaphroditum]